MAKNIRKTEQLLTERLSNLGLKPINTKPLIEFCYKHYKPIDILPSTLKVFKREKGSNFFVFSGITTPVTRMLIPHQLITFFYVPTKPFPDPSLSRIKVMQRHVFDKQSPVDYADRTAKEVEEAMKHKPSDLYFYWTHNHMGVYYKGTKKLRLISLKKGRVKGYYNPVDDGKSDAFDMLMHAALFQGDFFAITFHNNFFLPGYEQLKALGDALGIVILPGTEITMPPHGFMPPEVFEFLAKVKDEFRKNGIKLRLNKNEFGTYDYKEVERVISLYKRLYGKSIDLPLRVINGPHVTLLYKSPEIGKEVHDLILSKRDYKYAPLSSVGVQLIPTLKLLKQRYGNDIIVILNHPFCDLKLPSVGMGNRMETGNVPWHVLSMLINKGLVDAIAAFNPGVKEELHPFKPYVEKKKLPPPYDKEQERWNKKRKKWSEEARAKVITITKRKWGIPTFRANAMNMALGKHIKSVYKLPLVGEPDTHYYGHFSLMNPFMSHLGRAVSVMKGEVEKTVEGFFKAFFSKEIDKDYYAYAVFDQKKGMQILPERKLTFFEKLDNYMHYLYSYGIKGFFGVLLGDVLVRSKEWVKYPLLRLKYLIHKFQKE